MENDLAQIRVLVVDDHPLVRDGLSALVNSQRDMAVVAEAGTAAEALASFELVHPDVSVLDLRLPDGTGAQLAQRMLQLDPSAKVLVMSHCQGDADVREAMESGAAGYVFKTSARTEVLTAIRTVHAGSTYLSGDAAVGYCLERSSAALSRREKQVLDLLGKGLRNKAIAATLHISESTVKEYAGNMFGKLGVKDRTAAVTVAARRGLLHLHD